MTEKERILITVRTYPVFSQQYIETVCTGGINDQGQWRRLYPVPWRYVDSTKQYKTYDVVEVEIKEGKDSRPESRTPVLSTMKIVGHLDSWMARSQWVKPTILPSLKAMIEAGRSIGPVQVEKVLDFIVEKGKSDWTPAQLEKLRQTNLFEERKPLEKIPFDFYIKWIDGGGAEYNSYVMAWEFGETWRQYRHRYGDPTAKMQEVWMTKIFSPRNKIAFFMGNQNRFRDQFSICGIFFPPKEMEADESLW